MDRELVLAGLLIIGVTLTLLGVAPWSPVVAPKTSARDWERASWRALWWPSVPVVAVISVLIGWAVVEPATSDEPLPISALVISMLFLGLWIRALIRATYAAKSRLPILAGTIGLWWPRIVLSPELVTRLDAEALAATRVHETAHVRHRDPLRILLAQLITDVQWPWPAAKHRFDRWRLVLELARDEEARLGGTDGADLAAAVVVAAQLRPPHARGASLIDGSTGLEERIDRLLRPVSCDAPSCRAPSALAFVPVSLVGLLSGIRFGDGLVQAIVKWL